MKFIYDKYKLECDYWNPLANYPKDGYFYPLEQDENRVIKHPATYLGLICEKYATCAGLADGLVQLFNYFGINAKDISKQDNYFAHAMVKVYIIDDNGEQRVSNIDLSKEISPNWTDTRYVYNNGHPVRRKNSIRNTRLDNYDFFMKKNINAVNDSDQQIAIDFNPNNVQKNQGRKI